MAISEVRKWSGGPPGGPGVVGSPFQSSGSGRETLSEGPDVQLEVREWLGGPQGGAGMVGWPSQKVGTPSRKSGSGPVALPVVREWS